MAAAVDVADFEDDVTEKFVSTEKVAPTKKVQVTIANQQDIDVPSAMNFFQEQITVPATGGTCWRLRMSHAPVHVSCVSPCLLRLCMSQVCTTQSERRHARQLAVPAATPLHPARPGRPASTRGWLGPFVPPHPRWGHRRTPPKREPGLATLPPVVPGSCWTKTPDSSASTVSRSPRYVHVSTLGRLLIAHCLHQCVGCVGGLRSQGSGCASIRSRTHRKRRCLCLVSWVHPMGVVCVWY